MPDNEEGGEADVLKQQQTTSYARLTKKRNRLLRLMTDQDESVSRELSEFENLMRASHDAHAAYYETLSDEADMDSESQKFEMRQKAAIRFQTYVRRWLDPSPPATPDYASPTVPPKKELTMETPDTQLKTTSGDPASDVETPIKPTNDPTSSPAPKPTSAPSEGDKLSALMAAISLPSPDIQPFTGDVMTYKSFISAFDVRITPRTQSAADRLHYLDQHLRGEPRERISCCFLLPADEGYVTARKILEDEYGDSYKISMAYLNDLNQCKPIRGEDCASLKQYSLLLTKCRYAMSNLSDLNVLNHPHTMQGIVAKLPSYLISRWCDHACNLRRTGKTPHFSDLVKFVCDAAKSASDPVYGRSAFRQRDVVGEGSAGFRASQRGASERPSHASTRQSSFAVGFGSNGNVCVLCDEEHDLEECNRFLGKSVEERRQVIRRFNLCYSCLYPGHRASGCLRKRRCQRCAKFHPTALHEEQFTPVRARGEAPPETAPIATINSNELSFSSQDGEVVLHSIIPVKVKSESSKGEVLTYAFLDNGSSACFMSNNLKEELQVDGKNTVLQLRTMHGTNTISTEAVTDLAVTSLDGSSSISIPRAFTKDSIPIGHSQIPCKEVIERVPHLRHISPLLPTYFSDVEIGLLIGSNCPKAMQPLRVIPTAGDGPFALETPLGWTVYGPLKVKRNESGCVSANLINLCEVESFKELMTPFSVMKIFERQFEEQENRIGEKGWSIEDRKFMGIAEKGCVFEDGHFTLPLPFRNEDLNLPSNRAVAEKRAQYQKAKMMKDERYKADYTEFVEEIIDKGYASKVSPIDLYTEPGKRWYLPHHEVYNVNKGKIRVVFDCSASFQGKSLNDELLQGPDLTNSLVGVLTRFREHPIAFMADIEKMFYQVRVREDQWRFLRFLWWPKGDLGGRLHEYQMNVHTFGAISSPSIANYALRAIARFDGCSTAVKETIHKNFYVDDCLKSVPTEKDALSLIFDLTDSCKAGGFRLTKYVCNSVNVMQHIPVEERSKEMRNLDLEDKLPVERALGVRWNVQDDAFEFSISMKDVEPTRRGILASISSVYDPLGFIAPVLLPAKAILQSLCKENGKDWDMAVPRNHLLKWEGWLQQIPLLTELKINRCFVPRSIDSFIVSKELHVFSDASASGYGAVVYCRTQNDRGEIAVSFVIGKSRLAPIKTTTIPRLELTAALTVVKLGQMAREELTENLPVHYYTDSTTTLHYISSDKQRWPVFVANRVSAIRSHSSPQQWHYVPSECNPADEASRGLTAKELLCNSRWLKGPEFLWTDSTQWPTNDMHINQVEMDANVMMAQAEQPDPVSLLMEYFSDWIKLRRSVAVFLKVKCILKVRVDQKKGMVPANVSFQKCLDVSDLEDAEVAIVKFVQSKSFPKEFISLSSEEEGKIPSSSHLRSLDPILEDGVLKVGGRIRRARISHSMKHPIIMPKRHHVTSLIIRHEHRLLGHAGRNHVLCSLRKKFWIIRGNSAVRQVISKCVTCRKLRGSTQDQKMADLPDCRLDDDQPPFYHTGLDFFGPFVVRERRSNVKRYGVVFTCMVTRAIHLELASSLDLDSCLHALRRFIARRGYVKHIYSDNGTNFVGAWHEIQRTRCMDIEWHFNPPSASHMGGTWERMIRSVRNVLAGLLEEHGTRLDVESLHTLMCEVEAILNSRPITTVSSDPQDPEALTPNHILTGKTQVILSNPGVFQREDIYLRRRWRRVQQMANIFWQRWRKEYLMGLQRRSKWSGPKDNLSEGDIVLIKDDTVQRSAWPMGRVVATEIGNDGLVRTVHLQTSSSNDVRRPVTKLVLLSKNENEK